MRVDTRISYLAVLLAIVALAISLSQPATVVIEQHAAPVVETGESPKEVSEWDDAVSFALTGSGLTNFTNVECEDLTVTDDFALTDDAAVGGDLTVTGAVDADSTANFAGAVTFQGLFYSSFANLTVTDGYTLTPAYTTYALDTASAVTITLDAVAAEGQLLILINDDANATIIADTNVRSSDGNAITLAGAYDVVIFVYQDSEWLEIAKSANS